MPRAFALLCVLLAACTGHEGDRSPDASAAAVPVPIVWTHVTTVEQLGSALRAGDSPRPIVIDFHAAWCMPCVELERRTFVDPAVVAELRRFTTIKIDVTQDPDGELQQLFAAETLPNVLIYAHESGLARAIAERRPGVALPRPVHQRTSFVTPDDLLPLLATLR